MKMKGFNCSLKIFWSVAASHLCPARFPALLQGQAALVEQRQLRRLASPLHPRHAAAWESRWVARALQARTHRPNHA